MARINLSLPRVARSINCCCCDASDATVLRRGCDRHPATCNNRVKLLITSNSARAWAAIHLIILALAKRRRKGFAFLFFCCCPYPFLFFASRKPEGNERALLSFFYWAVRKRERDVNLKEGATDWFSLIQDYPHESLQILDVVICGFRDADSACENLERERFYWIQSRWKPVLVFICWWLKNKRFIWFK